MSFLFAAAVTLLSLGNEPAVSPDGRWLAYISDSGSLWIRPFAGGDARQLTQGASEPAFSPDGRTIAYRGKDGVYLLQVEGGSPRLLVPDGRRPRFSPDGQRIAYHTGKGLFVIAAIGGEPRQIHPSGTHATWSPDGARLLFQVCRADACDWWVSRADGSEPAVTGAPKAARPDLWLASGQILFTEKYRLWTTNLAGAAPRRLTQSEQDERSPAAAPDGSIVYTSRQENIDIYAMALDADRANARGPLVRITNDAAVDQRPSLSLEGRKIAWETSRGGNFEVWVKDLVSGQERAITNGPLREHMPAISRDGAKLLYDAHDGDKVMIFEARFQGGEPVKIWEENVGQGSFQWSAKGDSALYFHRAPPGTVGLMNLSSKQRTPILRHPKFNLSLADARLSPDERWIAFPVPYAPHRSRLAVARIAGKVIEDEREWTYLTPETWNASQPEWSPNGQWLYFLSDQTGKLAVHALGLSQAKTAKGEAKLVLEFPDGSPSIAEMRPRDIGLAIAKDKLAVGATAYAYQLYSLRP